MAFPNPPKTGAVGVGVLAVFEPNMLVAGALPKPADAGAGAPKPDEDDPKLNVVEAGAGDGLAVLVPNPPKVGKGAGARAGDDAAGAVVAPKLNEGGFAAGDGAGALAPNENDELVTGLGASAALPKENEGVVEGTLAAGAGDPKLKDGAAAGAGLACAGAPNRLVGVEMGAAGFASKGAGVGVFPNENKLLLALASAGLSVVEFALAEGEETAANGLPAGNEDATAGGITGAAVGGAVEKLNNPAFGGATL